MDIMRKLHSILAPGVGPANHSTSGVRLPEDLGGRSFADALRQAAQEAARRATPPAAAPQNRPAIESGAPGTANPNGVLGQSQGPKIKPENPEGPALDVPIDTLHIELRDTLESVRIKDRETLTVPEPILPPPADNQPTGGSARPGSTDPSKPTGNTGPTNGPAATGGNGSNPPAVHPAMLPPLGVSWTPAALRGTGAQTAQGVNGTDEGMRLQLIQKHDQYNHPAQYGVSTLNTEARLFRDAVDKGYVPNTPEGLGTLLAVLGQGAIGDNARPPAMTEYFRQFFAAERAANR